MELPIDEFIEYLKDINKKYFNDQEINIWEQKTRFMLNRLSDTAVRVASTSLLNKDIVIKDMSNEALAEAMQRHVAFRSGGKAEAQIPNSAWSMMLEAAKRLNKNEGSNG